MNYGLKCNLAFITFEPIVVNPNTKMKSKDWRETQVKIKTTKLPHIDIIKLANISSRIFYDGYIKATF
jgi:hypothetical protein